MKIRGYEVGSLIGESAKFRIYLGNNNDQKAIIKVAKTFEDGDVLAEEAGWFNLIRAFISQVKKMQEDLSKPDTHYDWLFANLVSSFLEPTQQDRRINIFEVVDTGLEQLIPLPKLRSQTIIDARTSVWILGRFLKIYSFYELLASADDNPIIGYANFSPADFLIGPEKHRLIYFNHSGVTNDVVANNYVQAVTSFILQWVAVDDGSNEQEYLGLLRSFATDGRVTCSEAHAELYQLISKLWGIQYHPFTYRNQESNCWETIEKKEG